MTLWVTVALGAATGLSGFVAWRSSFPPPPPLASALERLQHRPAPESELASNQTKQWLGSRTRPWLESFGLDLDGIRADARITATTLDAHVGSKVTSALLPLGFLAVIGLLLATAGLALPFGVLAGASVVAAGVGFIAPDLALRQEAARRRRDFTVALGSYLDLVAISLAGGMGTESALVEAARIGDAWPFRQLRRAIDAAQLEGATLWHALGELGTDLGIPALSELAASVALAGHEGAKVRSSIAVKADTLRALELANAEAAAQAATERLAIPTAMLLFGFVLLIGFPAVATVIQAL